MAVTVLLATSSLRAERARQVIDDAERISLHPLVEVLRDPGGGLGIDEVMAAAESDFLPQRGGVFSWGFTRDTFWYRIELVNRGARHESRLLELHTPWLDHIELYTVSPEGTCAPPRMAGDTLPFERREIPHRTFIFALELPPGTTTCYLRLQTRQAFMAPITLWQTTVFLRHDRMKAHYFGALFGALVCLLLFNIAVAIGIRRRSHGVYCLYLLAFIAMNYAYNGFAFANLWPRSPVWANVAYSLFIYLFQITGLLFTIGFLSTRQHLPRLHRLALGCIGLMVAALVISGITQSGYFYNAVAVYTSFLSTPLMVLLGAAAWFRGDHAARYFVVAAMATVAGAFITAGTTAGAFPYTFATFHAVEFGVLLNMALLSLALADRIRNGRRETERLREQTLQQAQNAKEELEQLVRERTAELEGLYDLTRQISDATTVVDILDDLYSSLAAFLPFDRVALALLDGDAEQVTAVWARGATSPAGIDSGYGQSLKQGSLASVLASGEPRIISDLEAYLTRHPDSESTRRILNEGLRSNLTVPLFALRRPVGFLFLASRNAHSYTPAHTRFMRQIAGHLAIVIEKSKLFASLHEAQASLRETNAQLATLARIDGLTGLANRRTLDASLETEWNRCGRSQAPISFLMLDIDWFKRFNDQYGHQAGDACLQRIADLLRGFARRTGDIVARYGGEEFSLLLPNCESASAQAIAAEICTQVAELEIPHIGSPYQHVTTSIGVATLTPSASPSSAATLVQQADAALYNAKQHGRNRAETGAPP